MSSPDTKYCDEYPDALEHDQAAKTNNPLHHVLLPTHRRSAVSRTQTYVRTLIFHARISRAEPSWRVSHVNLEQ